MSLLPTNLNFGKVRNEAVFTTVNTGVLKAQDVQQAGTGNVNTVVFYAPSEFATLAAAAPRNLMTRPGLSYSDDSNWAMLPSGARILRVLLTNNGTTVVGGTSFDLGTSATENANSDNIGDAVLLASLNAGVLFGATLAAFGDVGAETDTIVVDEDVYVTVTVNGTANTSGDLSVVVEYML